MVHRRKFQTLQDCQMLQETSSPIFGPIASFPTWMCTTGKIGRERHGFFDFERKKRGRICWQMAKCLKRTATIHAR